jgi:hypothetical protein
MGQIWWYILVLYLGMIAGFFLNEWLHKKKGYAGTLKVNEFEGKTVYLLELDRDPVELAEKKEILFRVRSSKEKASLSQ